MCRYGDGILGEPAGANQRLVKHLSLVKVQDADFVVQGLSVPT